MVDVPVRVIKLAPGVRLSCDRDSSEAILLLPEAGNVQLNRHALAILELCDGSRSRDRVVVDAIVRSPRGMRGADVIEFLEAAESRGWIIEEE